MVCELSLNKVLKNKPKKPSWVCGQRDLALNPRWAAYQFWPWTHFLNEIIMTNSCCCCYYYYCIIVIIFKLLIPEDS